MGRGRGVVYDAKSVARISNVVRIVRAGACDLLAVLLGALFLALLFHVFHGRLAADVISDAVGEIATHDLVVVRAELRNGVVWCGERIGRCRCVHEAEHEESTSHSSRRHVKSVPPDDGTYQFLGEKAARPGFKGAG